MNQTIALSRQYYDSPIGKIVALGIGDVLYHLDFADCTARMDRLLKTRFGVYEYHQQECHQQQFVPGLGRALQQYFSGRKNCFGSITLNTDGTPFQKMVWRTLQKIPEGQSWSYKMLAQVIGNPDAVRAVASANGKNPISIIIPCHRVIGSDGQLRGYAGGVSRKRWLLQHEGALAQTDLLTD